MADATRSESNSPTSLLARLAFAAGADLKPWTVDARAVSVAAQRAVLHALAVHASSSCGCVWCGAETLAAETGLSAWTVRRALVALCGQDAVYRRAQQRRADGTYGVFRFQLAGAPPCHGHGRHETPTGAPSRRGGPARPEGAAVDADRRALVHVPARPEPRDRRALSQARNQGIEPGIEPGKNQLPSRTRATRATRTRARGDDGVAVPATRGKARPADPLFDAVTAALGIDPAELTRSARGALNKAVKELRDVGADPLEVPARVAMLRALWRVPATATSLAKHWAELVPDVGRLPGAVLPKSAAALARISHDGNRP